MSDNPWDEKPQTKAQDALASAKQAIANGREWRLIENLVNGLFSEQKKARRWGIFFKSLTFLYLFSLLGFYLFARQTGDAGLADNEAHTALIELVGPISADSEASADILVGSLRRAFESEHSAAVIMRINSPGGSPVQSGYVYDEIKRLRAIYPDKKLYAVISDIGASGAYYIASAADYIYADKASLVGSIGVVSSGFGFVGLMEKLGVERRALSAGENKTFLDPFSPLKDRDRVFWQSVLETTHQQFIDQVKKGRGDRLVDSPDLFSGLIWTGEQALEKGLIDGLGSSSYVAREIIGVQSIRDYSPELSPFEEVIERFGVSFAGAIATKMGLNSNFNLQ
ncbi:MAG: S49 family peptidase [Oceanospirillaceae bacterium]|nr:S49 family peptidase [Oceanospirillaceae bacterium]